MTPFEMSDVEATASVGPRGTCTAPAESGGGERFGQPLGCSPLPPVLLTPIPAGAALTAPRLAQGWTSGGGARDGVSGERHHHDLLSSPASAPGVEKGGGTTRPRPVAQPRRGWCDPCGKMRDQIGDRCSIEWWHR